MRRVCICKRIKHLEVILGQNIQFSSVQRHTRLAKHIKQTIIIIIDDYDCVEFKLYYYCLLKYVLLKEGLCLFNRLEL